MACGWRVLAGTSTSTGRDGGDRRSGGSAEQAPYGAAQARIARTGGSADGLIDGPGEHRALAADRGGPYGQDPVASDPARTMLGIPVPVDPCRPMDHPRRRPMSRRFRRDPACRSSEGGTPSGPGPRNPAPHRLRVVRFRRRSTCPQASRPRTAIDWLRAMRCGLVADDLAGLEAGGAYVLALGGLAHERANPLDVRVPAALRATVRVRDAVPEAWALAADIAVGSHGALLHV
jgi:hypothetical protein